MKWATIVWALKVMVHSSNEMSHHCLGFESYGRILDWLRKKQGMRPDYVQEWTGRYRWSRSHGMILNSNSFTQDKAEMPRELWETEKHYRFCDLRPAW